MIELWKGPSLAVYTGSGDLSGMHGYTNLYMVISRAHAGSE